MKKTLDQWQVIALILVFFLHFALRVHQPLAKEPYVDEGFHIARALRIYEFNENPARFAHGKLLLYFYLGLFNTHDAGTMLPVSRMAIALISLLSSAGLYAIGRKLHSPPAGLLAAALYALNPLALFYERMTMADPLASALLVLLIWRSLIFAKRPTGREGLILGILTALTTMAKLTLGLAIFFPVLAPLIYGTIRLTQPRQWLKTYLPPLVLAGLIVLLLWSPFVIPAYLARNSDEPFQLVNSFNVVRTEKDPYNAWDYLQTIRPMLDEYLGAIALNGQSISLWGGLVLVWLGFMWRKPRPYFFVSAWFLATMLLIVAIARLTSTRYFVPMAAPLSLMLALLIMTMPFATLRKILLIPLVLWGMVWALPFAWQTVTNPQALPFTWVNETEHLTGYLTATDATRQAAHFVNQLPEGERLYATWTLCHLIFYYVEAPLTCLPQESTGSSLQALIQALAPQDHFILLISGYQPFYEDYDFLTYETLTSVEHEKINRPILILQMQHK